MSLKIAPVELRVLTKCFSASNQIVKDLYGYLTQSLAPATAGLETCYRPVSGSGDRSDFPKTNAHALVTRRSHAAEFQSCVKELLKELPGRPLPASSGGPEKFVTVPCY